MADQTEAQYWLFIGDVAAPPSQRLVWIFFMRPNKPMKSTR